MKDVQRIPDHCAAEMKDGKPVIFYSAKPGEVYSGSKTKVQSLSEKI